MKSLNKGTVFRFGVADDNIIVGYEEYVCDLTLGTKGFTRTGRTQNQAVGVFQLLSVNHDKVVGKSVNAAVQSFFAVLEQLLGRKRHKNSDA